MGYHNVTRNDYHGPEELGVAKKLGDPLNPEFAIGAVLHDGSFVLNEDVIGSLDIPKLYIDQNVT
ncbi:MAG TPA: hypothetical protein VFR61_01005, partial [Nitrososphaeraceae archaeon]|nr:hypothetical protein [Nitrososphaeraceae archaeon]